MGIVEIWQGYFRRIQVRTSVEGGGGSV